MGRIKRARKDWFTPGRRPCPWSQTSCAAAPNCLQHKNNWRMPGHINRQRWTAQQKKQDSITATQRPTPSPRAESQFDTEARAYRTGSSCRRNRSRTSLPARNKTKHATNQLAPHSERDLNHDKRAGDHHAPPVSASHGLGIEIRCDERLPQAGRRQFTGSWR